jgi:cytochrome b561
MIVMPLLGWGILSAEGKDIAIFGLPVFPLVSPGEETAEFLGEAHEVVATIGYILIGLHAVAALYHHYLRRDNTLRRMLPGRH